jgi:L-aspartate oxidase
VDSEYEHVQDTLHAGAGLCREKTVWHVVCHAREAIAQLIRWGVAFDRDGSDFHLTQEGGFVPSRAPRADAPGTGLIEPDRGTRGNNVEIFTNHVAIDLITTAKLGRGESVRRRLRV